MLPKSVGNPESIRSGRNMPYAIRELWLSMNTVPFQIAPRSSHISMHAAVFSTHMYPTDMLVHTVTHIHTHLLDIQTYIYTDISVNTTPN